MAIKFNERYPGRSLPASSRYPQGGFKNRSAPDSKDGTYLEQDWANDISGFLQWLLAKAEIQANGEPDSAVGSQYAEALFKLVNEKIKGFGNKNTADLTGTVGWWMCGDTGLIRQWGLTDPIAVGGSSIITLPVNPPTGIICINATLISPIANANGTHSVYVQSLSKNTIAVRHDDTQGESRAMAAYWEVICK